MSDGSSAQSLRCNAPASFSAGYANLLWRIVGGGQDFSSAFHSGASFCGNLEMVHRGNLT